MVRLDLLVDPYLATTYQYTVYQNAANGLYNLKDNITGNNPMPLKDYSDAATVIQYAVDNISSGAIFLKSGDYAVNSSIRKKFGVKIIGESRETTKLHPTGNFPVFIVGISPGIYYTDIADVKLYHNQAGFTTSLLRYTSDTKYNLVRNCDFDDSGTFAGYGISFENTAAANAGVGINLNQIVSCNFKGFAAAIYMSINNTGNNVSRNQIDTSTFTACTSILQCNGVSGSAIDGDTFNSCIYDIGSNGNPTVLFNYDDAASHLSTVHIAISALNINTANTHYINVNNNMGGVITLLGVVPNNSIGGSGAGAIIVNKESSGGSATGTVTTGANVGAGAGLVYRDTTASGTTINFKSLLAGSNLSITNNLNDITLAVPSFPYTSLTSIPTSFTPSTHASTHSSGSTDPITLSNLAGSVTTGQLPTGIPYTKIGTNLAFSETGLTAVRTVTFPDSSGTAVYTTDSRLSDSRTPTTHASTHSSGGTDPITLSNLAGTISDAQISTSTLTTTNTKTIINKTIDVQGPNIIKNATEYMYIVWFDGTNYNALNTHTGNIDSVNTDAWTVLNYAINTGANATGAVFIKKGLYSLSQTLKPVSNSNIKGEGWQQTQLRAAGNYPAITFDIGVSLCEVEDIFFTTAFTGYTSNILQFNNRANNNTIRRCVWYDFGVVTGNAIGFVNTGAANSGTGIIGNSFHDCACTGFTNFIYMQVVNASTTLPIDTNGNWINSNSFYNITVNAPTKRFSYCDGASGSVFHANNFFNSWMEASSVTDCAFYYDDSASPAIHASHKYILHSGVAVWDLAGGANYANVNDSTFITFTGCLSDNLIGGSATTAQKNTNLLHVSTTNTTDNFVQTLNNKALNATSITNSGLTTLQPTAAGGFETVLTSSISTSTDSFRIDNGYGTSGVFAPIIRATLTSTNANSGMIPLYFQGICTAANDTGTAACIVFGGMRTGQVALTTRPICEFQNQFNAIYTFYPTYLDFHNNSIKNSIILDTNGNQIGSHQYYDYLVYYDGAKFVARNGTTGAIDYSNTTDGAAVLNSAMSALTSSGGIVAYKGTILCRSTVVMQSLIVLKGIGEGASIKQDASQNLAVLVDSANFATLTGTNSTAGVYSVYFENVLIDGNKANNTTTATIGLRYFGYNWHVKGLHIVNCHGIGHYSEWGVSPTSPSTGTAMNSMYNDVIINLCDGIGWQMRGPHDTVTDNALVYQCGGVGVSVEYSANVYDGSSEWSNVHIFSCVGKGMDAKGGTVRFRGLTTESITSSGIGLHQEGAIVEGVDFESYNNTTGLKLDSGGYGHYSGSNIHDNLTDGVEINKNDIIVDGIIANNATKGIVLGTSGISLVGVTLRCYIYGHTTANIDWANANHQGIAGTCILYNDSTHQTPVLTPNNIDFDKNSVLIETVANGTATKFQDARPIVVKQAQKSPFYKKFGQYFCGAGTTILEGLYNGVVETGTKTFGNDQWLGIYVNFATTTTQNSKAGLNGGTAVTLFTRTSNPYKRTHLKIPTTASSRFYGGFSSATTLPTTDAPLASTDSGIIVGWNSTDTTIKIYNNDGSAAAPTATDSAITLPTGTWSYEILSDDANARFTVNIISGSNTFSTNITTRIPASATRLAVYDCVENTTTTAQNIQIDCSILESKYVQ